MKTTLEHIDRLLDQIHVSGQDTYLMVQARQQLKRLYDAVVKAENKPEVANDTDRK